MTTIKQVFAKQGQLSAAINGFVPRAAQTDMAVAVGRAISTRTALVVEAGTGTGKTFAYLVPALLSDKKAIISTGTKNLQEQLFHRDLPVVKQALEANKKVALLKGRSNYLCLHRLQQHTQSTTLLEKQTLKELTQVREWASGTKSGDVGELTTIAEDARVLPFVTSTIDNCLGKECPEYDDCFMIKARAKALAADLVVVNHHLFFADMALKDTGFGELIPDADLIVFDEAHQLPDIASQYFGDSLSTRQIQDMCKDAEIVVRTSLKDADQVGKMADKLRMIAADLRLLFPENPQKGNWRQQLQQTELAAQVHRLQETLIQFYEVLKLHLGRDKDLDNLFERCTEAKIKLALLSDVEQQGTSLWYETTPRHLQMHSTPLSIAQRFADFMQEPKRGWVFTSATLMVDGGFSHFTDQMGLNNADTLSLGSPFDYPNQAMLCVPRSLPEPSAREMKNTLIDISLELIKASNGRCFLLFTSHYMLREIARELESKVDNPLLVQGTTSKRALLEKYVDSDNAVLLGTGAFWEGVDVRGDDLTCVLIDKLPFASPDDPLLQARIEECRKQGGNPFVQIQIPQAVIALKQGAGRLIRDAKDRGVLVICDNRLVTKDYGKTFVASLPDMHRTRTLSKVTEFLEKIHQEKRNS
ncbi:ATP-dependent DNA helicase [Alteromonadaceae bacterium BrNp21-10]|nr:ATP-dependent DNA helicase [Alteromonadaceae bacterium BrNp21-10]